MSGNVYVADVVNNLVRKITPGGFVSTLAGGALLAGSNDGQGAVARFTNPNGVALDSSGNVYVADTGNGLIRKISSFTLQLPVCDKAWHHTALAYSPSPLPSLTAFIDGALVYISSLATPAPLPAARASSMLRVGWDGASNASFAGSLADLRVYPRALSAAEVLALSQPTAGSFPADEHCGSRTAISRVTCVPLFVRYRLLLWRSVAHLV